ncbi:integrase core domain-containing protein [Streptomyces sp. NPDC059467]|uniref:integrase core domain-containing protein n=1 Tax=Streptomyces sp. NPDC059467 TaxID=3346844 RepID=UPI003674FF17
MLRLLPMSDREKDAEILALRHQIAVLERQLSGQRIRFQASDRAFLAALLHRLPAQVLRRMRLPVRPDTVFRWHRDLVARRHAARSRPKNGGRPRTVHSVWEILKEADIPPSPERASTTWADFLRSQADALLACDFFETVTLSGARMYAFAVIEHANRWIRILGATAHPTASWMAQAAKNLVMDLKDAGIEVVLTGVRVPRMNSIMERWVQTCRRELLDRTLIWNHRRLLHASREFEHFYNEHRPHQGLANARPLRLLPQPITNPEQMSHLDIQRHDRLGGLLHEYQRAA